LGPLVGSMLYEKLKGKTYVFGTMASPITAKDVVSLSEFLKEIYPYSKVLAIDAALGKKEEIGAIKICDRGIFPGLGVAKKLPLIGDASIIGVVEESGKGQRLLSSVRMSFVHKIAEAVSEAISQYFIGVEESVYDGLQKSLKT
ncbi:MAG: spore protease YyaC, partial [Clostridia bacterium]|nr:spore protease YyaC [Clostridia bacterium]